MRKSRLMMAASLLVVGAMLLTGCGAATPDLGTEENPINWVFVPSGEMERVTAGAQSVADLIFSETGLVIETFVATDYTAAIEGMCADPAQAQMGSLATFAYIKALNAAAKQLVSVRGQHGNGRSSPMSTPGLDLADRRQDLLRCGRGASAGSPARAAPPAWIGSGGRHVRRLTDA
jgi:ABC-type phosphate/phosphonate transport system substrate-binding protein